MANEDLNRVVADLEVDNGSGVVLGSARSLLLTVLGELVYPVGRPVWSASLLYVLARVGVEEQTARQTIARCAHLGWLEGTKHGREVRWRLTAQVKRRIEAGIRRVNSLHSDHEPWDGAWVILLVTVPQSQRLVRRKLYSGLRWAGFGSPASGLWLSPHRDRIVEAEKVINGLGLAGSTQSFAGPAQRVGLSEADLVQRAWALDDAETTYQALIKRYARARPEHGDPILINHIELASQLQRLPYIDPGLPEQLLPDWIGRRAVALIQQRRSEWFAPAHQSWQDVVERTSP